MVRITLFAVLKVAYPEPMRLYGTLTTTVNFFWRKAENRDDSCSVDLMGSDPFMTAIEAKTQTFLASTPVSRGSDWPGQNGVYFGYFSSFGIVGLLRNFV